MSFKTLFGGKPWYKSMVGWGVLILIIAETAVPAASELGLADPELLAVLNSYMEKFAAVLAALGIRRRLPAQGVAAAGALSLVVLMGCTVYTGPAGFSAAVFGSAYTHHEVFADPPTAPPKSETEGGGTIESWTTAALRTFGTVGIEATVDMGSERIALTGKGMSKQMAGVIGEDVAAKIGQIVACSLQPAQPACVGIVGSFSELLVNQLGTDEEED